MSKNKRNELIDGEAYCKACLDIISSKKCKHKRIRTVIYNKKFKAKICVACFKIIKIELKGENNDGIKGNRKTNNSKKAGARKY